MARTKNPAPATARSAADTASNPATATAAQPAGSSPAAAVLAALSAESGGATVAVIAGHAGISAAAARQALLAQEKAGAATRVKGSRPGLPDTWKPAAEPAPAAEASDAGSAPGGQLAPAPADDTAEGETGKAGAEPGPDPAVTAEAAANVLAIAQAADEAGQALAAGDLPAAPTALAAARDQAACGRRVIKAAASGRRAPATRPGALRDLVEEHLRQFPTRPSPRTRSARCSPGRPARSPTPWTSWCEQTFTSVALGHVSWVVSFARNWRRTRRTAWRSCSATPASSCCWNCRCDRSTSAARQRHRQRRGELPHRQLTVGPADEIDLRQRASVPSPSS
jgi:hypothetical protein